MAEIVGSCVSQFHDDDNYFELLLGYSDGREVGHVISRAAIRQIAADMANAVPETPASPWLPMETAPLDGKHCILAIQTVDRCFVYSIQGAFMGGEWLNAANIKTEPLAWMPNVLLPDEFCPWTDEYKARAAAALKKMEGA